MATDIALSLNQPVQQLIKPKETQSYSVRVGKDYFVHIMVETKGIDVSTASSHPTASRPPDFQESMGWQSESLFMIA